MGGFWTDISKCFEREWDHIFNFFEGHLEEFLKHFVKKVYPRTTRQHSRYLYDMTCRLQEIQCLDLWEDDQILNDDNHRSLSDMSMSDNTNTALNHSVKEYLNIDNNSYLCSSKFRIIQSDIKRCVKMLRRILCSKKMLFVTDIVI